MKSSLKERLERLGPVADVSRVASGSPVVMFLRPATNRELKPVSATLALAKRGLSLLKGKRAVEEIMQKGLAVLELPAVESRRRVLAELAEAGIEARPRAEGIVNVKNLRKRLGLTQVQFALRYGIDIDTLQNWERRRRIPDEPARRLLRVIAMLPKEASAAQEDMAAREHAPSHG